ncbi:hypothetical protein H6P81_014512 [Aristolochia fimbriata]|uniref:Phytocyanin domain-containing protein n=1 Tax=Aristolochia fimbriata TaxID=158543 RepID=A0AAV7EIE6_ARIFI|nr:hypothetical protein H6P81_014512 [Aristolochia fimbriata]
MASCHLCWAIGFLLVASAAAKEHMVGESEGWKTPPSKDFYQEWANGKKFVVGDKLVFRYTPSAHSLVEVTEREFQFCTQHDVIEMHYQGHTVIDLDRPGTRSAGSARNGIHIVGGSNGWKLPIDGNSSLFQTWAENKQFVVGDELVFLFTTGVHNVLEVSESQFDACTHSFESKGHFTGPAIVRLSSPGNHYFICGVGQHCERGVKLNITVAPAALDKTHGAVLYESSATTTRGLSSSSSFQIYLLFQLLLFSSSFLYLLL